MREIRKGKTWGIRLLAFMAMLLLFCIPVSAGVKEGAEEYEIYPTPQKITYGTQKVALTDEINLSIGDRIDSYTRERITETLDILGLKESASRTEGKTSFLVGVYGSGDEADLYGKANGAESSLFEKTDAYMLSVKDGKIVVLGKDTDAAFYGVTTLKRIFEQITDKKIAELTITDYSDIQFRGFIEGYYGNPWSVEDRMELMKFGGEIKMNQYIFAPKDDPYHNAKWRELYPDDKLEDIKKLAQAGNESKCFFVWSIHCFMNNAFRFDTEEHYQQDFSIVTAKFSQLLKAGVRQFGVLADDAAAVSPESTVRLLNDLNQWLEEQQKTYPDLRRDILYCPNDYYGNGGSSQLKNINKVNRNVHIMATGGKIWGEVTPSFGQNYFNNIASTEAEGRYPYMWVNWPCSDNSKNHLIMGGQNTFLHAGVDGSTYEGIVLNPMQQSEPSKVAIFTCADYAWKCWKGEAEGDQAWEDSFKYVDHVTAIESEESAALREMSKHMINQAMDGRVTALEESVELAPKLNDFWSKLQSGGNLKEAISVLRPEFEKLNEAANCYLEKGQNRRLASQAEPFLKCMRNLTQANLCLLDALEAKENEDENGVWENFANAQSSYEDSSSYGFDYVGETKYAEVGNQHIVPFTNKVMKYVSDMVQQILDPEHIKFESTLIFQVGGSTASSNLNGALANATDGSTATATIIQRDQVVGDYAGLTFNKMISVENIEFAFSTTAHPNDFFYDGVMEYTLDGNTWTAFDEQPDAEGKNVVSLELSEAVEIKGFRYRCTSLGGKNRWLAVREISYNKSDAPQTGEVKYAAEYSCTSGWSVYQGPESNMTDGDEGSYVWYNPTTTEKDNSLAGDYIALDLGETKSVGRVRALIGAGDGDKWTSYHLEYSSDGQNWTRLSSYTGKASGADTYEVNLKGETARYLRIVNDVTVAKWVKFCEFSAYSYAESGEGDPMDYTNTTGTDWRVEYGESVSEILPMNQAVLQKGEYIGLKLDRIHDITEIAYSGAGTEKLTLERSMNQTEWSSGTGHAAARYIRLANNTDRAVTFDLDSFTVTSKEIQPMDLVETTMGIHAAYGAGDARNTNTTRNWFDQNLNSRAIYSDYPAKDDYILYTLGQEMEIHSVKVYVLDTEIDYPRDAVLEVSDDLVNWTEILTIGDGVENTSDDASTAPVDNGWIHDTVDPAFAYMENTGLGVTAKYIRMRMTANYNSRFVALNEICLNDGAYICTINDPTYVTVPNEVVGFEPQNLNDQDLTTAFKPDMAGRTEGSVLFRLSDTTKIRKLNIVQSGKDISNAMVSVRTGEDTWVELGRLDKSLNSFYTYMYEDVFEVKIQWENATPVIYEIIPLEYAGDGINDLKAEHRKKLENELSEANDRLLPAAEAAADARKKLAEAENRVAAAEKKVADAADPKAKLTAEVELYAARAEANRLAVEAAWKNAEEAQQRTVVVDLEAEILTVDGDAAGAAAKKAEADALIAEVQKQKAAAAQKASAQEGLDLAAEAKKTELQNYKVPVLDPPRPVITTATVKGVNYKILNKAKKTAAVTGTNNKKISSVSIAATVKIDGVTYKVTQINAKAFKGCKKLAKVTIGKNINKIEKEAFAQCSKLSSVNMKKVNGLTSVKSRAFAKINVKAKITVPSKKLKKYTTMLKRAGLPKNAKVRK